MFKRIFYEDWTQMLPEISFCLTFAVFLAITIRALMTKKDKVDHMANLPLEDDTASKTNSANNE